MVHNYKTPPLNFSIDGTVEIKGFQYATIKGDLLHINGNEYYFADGGSFGNVPEDVIINPWDSKFPLTTRKNLEFFCSESYKEFTWISDFEKEGSFFKQELELVVDKRMGSIIGSAHEKYSLNRGFNNVINVHMLSYNDSTFIQKIGNMDGLRKQAQHALIASLYFVNNYHQKKKKIF